MGVEIRRHYILSIIVTTLGRVSWRSPGVEIIIIIIIVFEQFHSLKKYHLRLMQLNEAVKYKYIIILYLFKYINDDNFQVTFSLILLLLLLSNSIII